MTEGVPPSERYDAPDEGARAASRSRSEYGAEAPADPAREFPQQQSVTDATFSWPPVEGASVVGAFMQTWQAATFHPTAFFRALPSRGSLGSALLYYLPLSIIIAGAELFWRMLRGPVTEQDSAVSTLGAADAVLNPLVWFLLSPLLQLVSLFLSAAVTHALLKLFGGTQRDIATSVRVFAFAYSPMLVSVVPVIGPLVGFVWVVVVAIIGLREAQRTTTGRAAAAVLIPVCFALLMLVLAYLLRTAGALLEMPM